MHVLVTTGFFFFFLGILLDDIMLCYFISLQIRPAFEEHGDVIEVALIKDKRTGQQQGMV